MFINKFEQTTERHCHKFKLGARFINPGPPERYGRVVGWDGKYYQLYYPKTLACESMLESVLSTMNFVSHKRPRMKRKLSTEEHRKLSEHPVCGLCNLPFQAELGSGKCPVQSQNCSHLLCFDCIQAIRVRETQSSCKKTMRSTVDCPFCEKTRSFNAVEPTICQAMCQMVSLLESRVIDYSVCKKKIFHEKEAEMKSSSSSDTATDKNVRCPYCNETKPAENYSTKQTQRRINGKRNFQCRRCEEKEIITRRFGNHDNSKYCTSLSILNEGSKKPKFLATILPVSDVNGNEVFQCHPLPGHLNITGYTREEYARLSNTEQENLWTKCYFWCTNDKKMMDLLNFLSSEKKSAYGIFLLEDKETDGFFIIPHDQPGGLLKGILMCNML
jgi:hypothetical protein